MAGTTQGLKGLTFEGALSPSTNTVGRLDNLRATGNLDFGRYDNEPETRFRQAMRDIDYEGDVLNQMATWRPSRNERMQSQHLGYLGTSPSEDIGFEAAAAGYGESRLDRRFVNPQQLVDIEDSRAREQSTLGILANSVAKMGVLAGTTAADSWVGLPAGLINLTSQLSSGNIDSGSEAFNAIVSNPVSAYLQSINDKSEDIFRNYQTDEERNRPWWENMFTANFIGDTLIKNAGFTIGAVLGGKVAVDVLGNITNAKKARDAFKGMAAELGLQGKNASEAVELLAKGTTSLEKQAAVKALAESATKLKDYELGLRIAGGLLAGTGEARIEALNSANELERSYSEIYGNLDLERGKALSRVRDELLLQGVDLNSPEGQKLYNERKALVDENFLAIREQIAHDKAMAANTVFALNVPLLTFGDMAQWGKMMLGGYATDRGVINGIRKVADKSIAKSALSPKEVADATRYAVKGTNFTRNLEKAAAASKNVFIEAQEEMNQSFFSATAKAKAMGDTTEFMERLYDPMAVSDTVSWLNAAKEGMRESWLNKDDWVEGFAGGFMGFLGLPSISVKVDEKTGKQTPKISMEGGIWSPMREHSDLYKRRSALVNSLNARLASPEFLNYYYGKIGNRHFDSIKEDAVKSGDKNLYKKADHAQLVNDAMMFANAGRLQDFIDIIDSFENVSDETVKEIKALFPDSSDVQSYTTSGMRNLISENVSRMKRQLDSYMKIADNVKTVYGNTISDETAAEITWQTAHLDEIENDLKEILSHPDTLSFLSQYRAAESEKTKDLTDQEVVSSNGYGKWLADKYADKKDTANKLDLERAMSDANDARYDMRERLKYIDNLSSLSSDPELILKRRTRIKKQQDELRRISKMIKAADIMSRTDKLSDFITAMEEIGDEIPESTLADIKREADAGNNIAADYLIAKDVDSDIAEYVRRIGEKSGASEEQIKQALDAWEYFKHNSDSAAELTAKHSASDVASSVAGESAVNLLNEAVDAIMKSRDLYKRIVKRPSRNAGKGSKGGETTSNKSLKTTGKKLTEARYKEICDEVKSRGSDPLSPLPAIHKIDFKVANVMIDGESANGVFWFYYPKGTLSEIVVFDNDGNEIAKSELDRISGPNGESLVDWLNSPSFPISAHMSCPLLTPSQENKWKSILPVGKKSSTRQKSDTSKNESGKNPGAKTNPHKFIAPNMDIAMLGGDSKVVAEALRSLPEDSEVRFGILEEDGPIYILAGDSNVRIGTLPSESDGSDTYSGLAELSQLIRDEFKQSSDRRNADGMWISENYVNHIREKSVGGFETIDDNIPINDIPGFERIKSPIIMLVDGNGDYHISDKSVRRERIRQRNIDPLKPGFPYLLVPYNGDYIPVMLYTQNVNTENLDLNNPEVIGSGFGKRLSDSIDSVVKAITSTGNGKVDEFEKAALNKKDNKNNNSLQRLLYTRSAGENVTIQFFIPETCQQHPAWFTNPNTLMVINRHNNETGEDDWTPIVRGKERIGGGEYSIRNQIIDTLFNYEYKTEAGETHTGPLVQIHPDMFNNPQDLGERIREWIDAKMLLTDVRGFDLEMPSYVLDYWSVSQKKFIRPAHPVEKKSGTSARVTTKKVKGRGSERIVDMNLGGNKIKFNITTGKMKIGASRWFTGADASADMSKKAKDMGYKDAKDLYKTSRALAIIASKYENDNEGEGRIGDKVLLKGFSFGRDAGFIITGDGGRFMTNDELLEFKYELKGRKASDAKTRRDEEKRRLAELMAEERDDAEKAPDTEPQDSEIGHEDDAEDIDQETYGPLDSSAEELRQIETVSNVREAIDLLKKNAPQYAPFLDYISGIGYYDEILVKLADLVGSKPKSGTNVTGRNEFRFSKESGTFTDRIVIGRKSLGYQTLMHELVHAFTFVAMKYDNSLFDDVKALMEHMASSLENKELSDKLGRQYNITYAFQDPYEFIAEFFSNPVLQDIARSIKIREAGTKNKPTNLFSRIINRIAVALHNLLHRGNTDLTLYDKIENTLHKIIDRQAELQEMGKMVFKTDAEFKKSVKLASGSEINGVAMSLKIPTVETVNQEVATSFDGGRDHNARQLRSYSGDLDHVDNNTLALSQLLHPGDDYANVTELTRLLRQNDVYEYDCGVSSSLIGIKEGEVFITVRANPVTTDGSYDSLIRDVVNNDMPVVIATNTEDAGYYTKLGMRLVDGALPDGKVLVSNPAFTNGDLFKLGTTFRPFADVLDSNASFVALRREAYSDSEWDKFSEIEKYHARKCIGI